MARRPAKKTVESRLTTVERGIKSLQVNDAAIIRAMRDGFTHMERQFAHIESQFAHMESRFDQIYNHIDGFMKLHETLDIEFRVIKEQMRRLEERIDRLEAS
jgi:chaperonin cofactor prefoldin